MTATRASRVALVFSTHPLHPDATAALQARAEFRVASAPSADAIMAEGLEADVLVVRAPIPPAYFAAALRLRAAVRHGAGLDMIPMGAATAAGVLVANVPGANAVTVAEHAIFAAIALLRRFREVDAALRGQGWEHGRAFADHGRELGGRVLGIVGMGHIGTAMARIAAQGFGMQVAATTRRPASLPPGIMALALDDLVARADVLVLCCPLTEATRGLISASRIAAMKPGAILINVARGPVVDEGALVAGLQSGHLAGAALDVFATQPLPRDHALFALPNVILTPHMAGITQDSMARIGAVVVAEVLRVLSGQWPVNLCNPEVAAAFQARFPGAAGMA